MFESALGQDLQKNVFVHNWFDNITGIESSDIHYGQVYTEKHRLKSTKTKFFVSPEFRPGEVYFNNQPYFNLNLKYDVHGDNLILQVKNELGGIPLLLRNEHVDSFAIEQHRFKNVAQQDSETGISAGFYEIYRTTPFFNILKKHGKRLVNSLGNTVSYDEFEDLDPTFILEYKNEFFVLKRIKEVSNIFPDYDLKIVVEQLGRGAKLVDDSSIDVLIDFLQGKLSETHDDE
ncbi:hypothetical protein [Flagellimonas sp. 2504JD4-2]